MNAFERMLRERFGLKEAYEMALVTLLEQILGPADEEKARKLIAAIMDKKNKLLLSVIIDMGETAVLTYCKSLGYLGGVKDMLIKAAEIVKQQER
ncbi:MAG TPA: hypothetical protein DDZ05_01050 [Candidatus Blackburnbacteria bacterium]|nr:hypothetical protein [Candidatus Blackburnbacteria bacterium]